MKGICTKQAQQTDQKEMTQKLLKTQGNKDKKKYV